MFLNYSLWRSLKTRVTLLTLVIFLISIWLLAIFASQLLREDIERRLGDELFSTVSLLAKHIDESLTDRLEALEAIASTASTTMLGDTTRMQVLLEQRPLLQKLFNGGVIAVRADGTTIADVPPSTGRIGVNYMDRSHIARALKEGKSGIGPPGKGRKLPAAIFSMAAPIRDAQNRVIGALVGTTDLSKPNFLDQITQSKYGKSGGYVVNAPQHRLTVTASDKDLILRPNPKTGLNPLFDRYVQGFEGYGNVIDSRGFHVYSAAKQIPAAGWLLIGRISADEVLAPISAMQQRVVLLAILFTLLAGTAIGWTISLMLRRQFSPMISATKALATLRDANQPTKPLLIKTKDEVGELIEGFNRLLETLGHRQDELRTREEQLRTVMENTPDSIMQVSREGKITFISQLVPGLTRENVIGSSIYDWVPREQHPVLDEALHAAFFTGVSHEYETKGPGPNGEMREYQVRVRPVEVNGRAEMAIFTARDITERKRMENELRVHESRYHAVVEASNDGFWVVDTEGHLRDVNEAYVRRSGFTREELLGMHVYDLDAKETEADAAAHIRTIMSKGGDVFETLHRGKDGTLWPVEVSVNYRASESEPMLCFLRDITERKEAEAVIRASEARNRAITQFAYDGIITSDSAGIIVGWNQGAEKIFGYTEAEILGKPMTLLMPERYRDKHLAGMSRIRSGGQSHVIGKAIELKGLSKDGREFPLELSLGKWETSEGWFITGIIRDITERRRTEEVNAWLAAVVANSNDAIVGRMIDGTIISWNAAAERIFGYTAVEVIGHKSVQPSEVYREIAERLNLAAAGEPVHIVETERITKDGRRVNIAVSESVIKDNNGLIIGSAAIMRDITERKQLEAQHLEAQKLESLGTLAGGIAHDFNNALAAIIGNLELARQDVGPGHAALESLEEIGKASRRAKSLVHQILTFGRRQSVERKVIALAPVVLEATRLLRATLPAGIGLDVDCTSDTPAVLADAAQIEQVLLNLCTNAWHAVEGQERAGVIDIRLAGETRGNQRFASLAVRDNGRGMDEATRARMFEPFFTTKSVDKGTGLGMSVVHGIVKEHVASIEVESTPGLGTTVLIRFPAAQVAVEAASRRDKHVGEKDDAEVLVLNGGGKHVLYIDDEEAIVLLMTRLLERQGYRVSGYTDSQEALAAAHASPEQFDLAVTDYNMPGMSGLEVASALREIRADMPVALATGYVTDELREQASLTGVSELIYKPNTVEELCGAVARLARAAAEKRKPF